MYKNKVIGTIVAPGCAEAVQNFANSDLWEEYTPQITTAEEEAEQPQNKQEEQEKIPDSTKQPKAPKAPKPPEKEGADNEAPAAV